MMMVGELGLEGERGGRRGGVSGRGRCEWGRGDARD